MPLSPVCSPATPSAKVTGIAAHLSRTTVDDDLYSLFKAATASSGQIHHVVYTAADSLALGPLQETTTEGILEAAHLRMVAPIMLGKVALGRDHVLRRGTAWLGHGIGDRCRASAGELRSAGLCGCVTMGRHSPGGKLQPQPPGLRPDTSQLTCEFPPQGAVQTSKTLGFSAPHS